MILIPGLECPAEVWQDVIQHYGSQYQIHAITIAGFAGEPAVPGLKLAQVKDELVEYIQHNRLSKPILMGHSLGGFLAFWIGARAPDLIGGIISIDGLPFLPALMGAAPDAEKFRSLYASLTPDQLGKMSRMALEQMISDPKRVDLAANWAAKSDPAFVGQAMYDLMTTDLRPELRKLHSPVLLIGAGKAFSKDPEQLSKIRVAYEAQVRGASDRTVIIAEHALHFVMFDDPDFLYRAIDEFLGRQE